MLIIRWRPSGGRGEYESVATGKKLLGKTIYVRVPGMASTIPTDVQFKFVSGKPRLRRKDPYNKKILNIHELVAAIGALPEPRRADMPLTLPLKDKTYIVEELAFDILEESEKRVVVEPVYVRPLHGDVIDIQVRLEALGERQGISQHIDAFLTLLAEGLNTTELAKLASKVHTDFPSSDPGEEPPKPEPHPDDELIEDYVGKDGKQKVRWHRQKERDRKLPRVAKRRFRAAHGRLFCECCGFDFEQAYGELGWEFIEAHHIVPLSQLTEETELTADDLAMLCSNCHRMVHRTEELSIEEVRLAMQGS